MSGFRFSTIRLATGPLIHYAERGDGSGDPVLFLHGWPDSWFSFSRVVPLLPRGIRVLMPDQRGFGDSEKPDAGYAIADFAADAVAFLDALSINRATIVGHSFGSFVARCTAIAHPERVARLVLIGTAVSAGSPAVLEAQTALRDLTNPVPLEFVREFQSSTAFVPLPDSFFERIIAESMKLPARLWRETLNSVVAYNDTAALGRITVPTLLLWGERDALFARQDQDRLMTMIAGAAFKSYPETGHCPNWERPEIVAADLVAFLGQHVL